MGVTGDLLPRILRTSGRKIDLSTYKHGVIDSVKDKSKRQRTSSRRPIRIALDVGTMVARAAHGHGSMLLDERHLTNYGRSLLQEEANAPPEQEDPRQAITSDENRREYVDRCAGYVMKRIHTLQNVAGAQLLVVFDGATPPIKNQECVKRSMKREEAAKERDEPLEADEAAGDNTKRRVRAARRAGAGKNHGDILVEVMQALRKEKIPFMVAPYEADGQLAFLSKVGLVDLVVTEDSDLIAHGCDSILYKTAEGLGKGVAEGILVQRGDLGALGLVQKSISLVDFSDVMLAVMFVALGCDYCSSLRQIGSVAAQEIVRSAFHGEKGLPDEERERPALEKVFEALYRQTSEKNLSDDFKKEYEKSFLEALLMYRHPMIYDPFVGKCVLLRNPPFCSDPELMDYEPYARLCTDKRRREQLLGTCHGSTISTRIAEGWINPHTKRPYENMEIPATAREAHLSLSASDETDGDEDDRAQTQELASPAARSQPQSVTKGLETQDTLHVESQLGRPARSHTEGPETQDMAHVESQLRTPPGRRTTTSKQSDEGDVLVHDVVFKDDVLGLSLFSNLCVASVSNKALENVKVGDKLIGVNEKMIDRGTSRKDVCDLIASLPRPIKVSFSRKIEGKNVDDAIVINEEHGEQDASANENVVDLTQSSPSGSSKPSQSPLTGSSVSKLESQPSQSAVSQASAGVNSPDLLASQPS